MFLDYDNKNTNPRQGLPHIFPISLINHSEIFSFVSLPALSLGLFPTPWTLGLKPDFILYFLIFPVIYLPLRFEPSAMNFQF